MRALILLLLVAVGPALAENGKLEVSIGQSSFAVQPDGIWYQEPFPHSLHTEAPNFSVGYVSEFSSNLRLRVGYAYLGRITSTATVVNSDWAYDAYGVGVLQHIGQPTPDVGAIAMFTCVGRGTVQELYAVVQPQMQAGSAPLWLFAEGGVGIYRATWVVDVYAAGVKPFALVHQTNYSITPVVGVGVRWKGTSVALDVQKTPAVGDKYPALYAGTVYTFNVRHEF
jgi:hypothetical protein